MSGLGHRGSSRGHGERWLSGTFMCGRSECNATASNVPDGESNYQRGAGGFLSGLMRDWGYINVKAPICDRYEVPERLPWMEGANCSCWSTWSGVTLEGQMGKVSRWSRKANRARGKAISTKYQLLEHVWCLRIELPELLQGWMMVGGGWEIALTKTNLFLPIQGIVLRKT